MADPNGTLTITSIPPLLERAKLAFVLALRSAFKSDLTNKDIRYNDSKELSKIRIYTAHPLTMEFYPSLVVSTGGGDASFTYLMDDFVEEQQETSTTPGSVTFAGKVVFTISLTIFAGSTLERERILDHLILFLRHIFRPSINAFGLVYTKDIRVGAETLMEVENKPVYEQVIEIPCYMEYELKVDQSTLDTIRQIDLTLTDVNTFES